MVNPSVGEKVEQLPLEKIMFYTYLLKSTIEDFLDSGRKEGFQDEELVLVPLQVPEYRDSIS